MPRRMGRFSREEWELRQALRASAADAAREEARDELNMQLALEESGQDYWWSQLPPQLCWLRRPDSLQLLLQRPVWLDAWRQGEERRAALLWSKLPDDAIQIVLDFHEHQRRQRLATYVIKSVQKWRRSIRPREQRCPPPASNRLVQTGLLYVAASRVPREECVCQ